MTEAMKQALIGCVKELESVLDDINADRIPHDGDEFHERLQAARAAISQAQGGKAGEAVRWYCLSVDGMATLCSDEDDARQTARDADLSYPRQSPHQAVQLAPVTHPAPGVPAKLPSAYATSTESGVWRVLLEFNNKDDAEATRAFLHANGVAPRSMATCCHAPGVPEIDYTALINAAFATNKKWAQGTTGCIAFARGAEWFRASMLAAAPAQKGGE